MNVNHITFALEGKIEHFKLTWPWGSKDEKTKQEDEMLAAEPNPEIAAQQILGWLSKAQQKKAPKSSR